MMRSKKYLIEMILYNIGLLFFMFFPERSSLFPTMCLGLSLLIIDALMIIVVVKYKGENIDLRHHKVLKTVYYLSFVLIFLAFGYLLIE